MKRILQTLIAAVAYGIAITGCNVEAKFSDYIPTHPLQGMVKSATASCGGETVSGSIDNTEHEIRFVFVTATDFSEVSVTIDYATRTILKEGAFEGGNVLNLNSPYTMVLNNQEEDFTYRIVADRALIAEVDRTQCSVIESLDNDAPIGGDNISPEYLFDGRWMSMKEAYGEISYQHFGWNLGTPDYDDKMSFTFDVGEPMKLARLVVWPYWPYNNQAPALYEFYAWPFAGEPSGNWTNWVRIAVVDDSWKWEIVRDADPGSENDLCRYGTTVEFEFAEVTEARYYRFKMEKNFYGYYGSTMNASWEARKNYFAIAELQVWRYNLDE